MGREWRKGEGGSSWERSEVCLFMFRVELGLWKGRSWIGGVGVLVWGIFGVGWLEGLFFRSVWFVFVEFVGFWGLEEVGRGLCCRGS